MTTSPTKAGAHTPGPWQYAGVAHDEDGEPGFFSITAGCLEVLNTASGDVPTRVEEANARLAAAAPLMLEALQFALRDMEATREQFAANTPNVGVLAASIAATRAAIAAATGAQGGAR